MRAGRRRSSRLSVASAGTKELLVERLETSDACAARPVSEEREEPSRKRKALVSEEEQRELDLGLLRTAETGSLAEVRDAISGGANINCVDDDRWSPLMLACRRQDDWSVAEAIVSELLSAGAVVNMCTDIVMALHLAAAWSSSAIVTLLRGGQKPGRPRI
jgi:hypothetical protein